MLFGHHTVDKTMDEHLREIAALASDPHTLVFLDTNILAYLYKLHEAARQEFFTWLDSAVAAGRLAIPAWAASEYLSRVTAKSLDSFTPKSKEPSQARRALDALHETAALFVDDSLLNKVAFVGNRAAYLSGFRNAIDALDPYIRAFSHQFDPGVIHQQVVDHLDIQTNEELDTLVHGSSPSVAPGPSSRMWLGAPRYATHDSGDEPSGAQHGRS